MGCLHADQRTMEIVFHATAVLTFFVSCLLEREKLKGQKWCRRVHEVVLDLLSKTEKFLNPSVFFLTRLFV